MCCIKESPIRFPNADYQRKRRGEDRLNIIDNSRNVGNRVEIYLRLGAE